MKLTYIIGELLTEETESGNTVDMYLEGVQFESRPE
jgi:hypothetical protein